jgi:hypothetical protein
VVTCEVTLGVVERLEVVNVVQRNAIVLTVPLCAPTEDCQLLVKRDPVADVGQWVVAGLLEQPAIEGLQLGLLSVQPLVESGDPSRGDQSRVEIIGVEWLLEVVVGPSLHPSHHVGLSLERREQDEICVRRPSVLPHSAA